jgi:hypothetical protein
MMLADMASPFYVTSPLLFAWSVASFCVIVLIESVLLRLFRWGRIVPVLLTGFFINLVTSLIGTGFIVVFPDLAKRLPFAVWFAAAFILTVAIEGVLLKAAKRSTGFGRAMLLSGVINLASYFFLWSMMMTFLNPPTEIEYRFNHPRFSNPSPGVSPARQ